MPRLGRALPHRPLFSKAVAPTFASGDGAISISATFAGVGSIFKDGAGSQAWTVTPAGVGARFFDGAGAEAWTVTFAGVGALFTNGAGSVAVTLTFAGVGTTANTVDGAGAQSWTVTPAGVGSRLASGAGAIPATVAFAGAGTRLANAAGSQSWAFTLAGVSGGGPPPPPPVTPGTICLSAATKYPLLLSAATKYPLLLSAVTIHGRSCGGIEMDLPSVLIENATREDPSILFTMISGEDITGWDLRFHLSLQEDGPDVAGFPKVVGAGITIASTSTFLVTFSTDAPVVLRGPYFWAARYYGVSKRQVVRRGTLVVYKTAGPPG